MQEEMPTRKPRISFVVDEELKETLETWASEESRSVSNLCELVVRRAAENWKASKKNTKQKGGKDN